MLRDKSFRKLMITGMLTAFCTLAFADEYHENAVLGPYLGVSSNYSNSYGFERDLVNGSFVMKGKKGTVTNTGGVLVTTYTGKTTGLGINGVMGYMLYPNFGVEGGYQAFRRASWRYSDGSELSNSLSALTLAGKIVWQVSDNFLWGLKAGVARATSNLDIDSAFSADNPLGGAIVLSGSIRSHSVTQLEPIVELAADYRIDHGLFAEISAGRIAGRQQIKNIDHVHVGFIYSFGQVNL